MKDEDLQKLRLLLRELDWHEAALSRATSNLKGVAEHRKRLIRSIKQIREKLDRLQVVEIKQVSKRKRT